MINGKNAEQRFDTADDIRHISSMISSYLWLGDIEKLKLYLGIFHREIENKPMLLHFVSDKDRKRIESSQRSFDEGKIPNPWGCDTMSNSSLMNTMIESVGDGDVVKEADLQKILSHASKSIMWMTGETKNPILTSEQHVSSGRIDLKAVGENTCHLIELKRGRANHMVVGQIMKYMRDIGGKLHHRLYDDVKGYTVAREYTGSALLDLKMLGISVFRYSDLNGEIKMKQV